MTDHIPFRPLGCIRTPYSDWAPHQPVERDIEEGKFRIVLEEQFVQGLSDLDRFSHIYVLYHMDRVGGTPSMSVSPPWAHAKEVGLFASRSPDRPNPIGLSIVKVVRIQGNEILISPIDALDGTPLLDIKPYFGEFDAKAQANNGWAEDLDDWQHVLSHVRGVQHGHHHGHDHDHDHAHKHDHGHSHEKGHKH